MTAPHLTPAGPPPSSWAVADCHNDLLMAVRYLRERGHVDPFGDAWLPQLRAGGVRLQVLPVCTEEQYVGEGALRRSLLMLAEARHLAAVPADAVVIVEEAAAIAPSLESGRIVLLLALEGAEPIGHSLEILDALHRVGIRMCSLSWNRRTLLADGVAEQDTGGRLTGLGVAAVARLEELRIMVDVSHLSPAGFDHLAEVATRPFIASHSSCQALVDHPRNLSDVQLRVMAETGSMVCLNAFGPFVADADPDVHRYIDHIEHALGILGPDLVGLGTDFITDIADVVDPVFTGLLVDPATIPHTRDLQRPADFPRLVPALRDRLGDDLAAKVLGTNLPRFLAEHL